MTEALNPVEWTDRERRLIRAFAWAMHELTCGSWDAAGYDTKVMFSVAAAHAVVSLNLEGLDLLDLLVLEDDEQA